MQDKKKQILDAAIRCFARKGFHAASIQDIADELGMAKGSIYFYFKSKDELLISVLEHYGDKMSEQSAELPEERELPPRRRLELQLERQFRFFRNHLDFIRMMFNEQPSTDMHPRIRELMMKFTARSRLWSHAHLKAIYGEEILPYASDASAMLSGIVGEYLKALFFDDGIQYDENRLGRFLVSRLDDVVAGMKEKGDAPVLPPRDMSKLRALAGMAEEDAAEGSGGLKREVAESEGLSPDAKAKLLRAIELLESRPDLMRSWTDTPGE